MKLSLFIYFLERKNTIVFANGNYCFIDEKDFFFLSSITVFAEPFRSLRSVFCKEVNKN